jgi:hypothetical protein
MNDLLGCLVALGVLAPFVLVIGGIYWDVYKTYEDEWDAKRRERERVERQEGRR